MNSQSTDRKWGKKQKNLYLSDHARKLLAVFSHKMGVSETAVVELLIREKAERDNVVLEGTDASAPGSE